MTNKPIKKESLPGKYILFLDKDGKYRTEKVKKVVGKVVTVVNAIGEKTRIYDGKLCMSGQHIKILGKVTPTSKTDEAQPIDWGKIRGKNK